MLKNLGNQFKFWQELKRRKLTRVIPVYAAAAFVILEVVSIIVEPLRLPEWTLPFIIVLLVIGFFISIVFSWIYNITPVGVKKTKPLKEDLKSEKPPKSNIWRIVSIISIVVIVGLIILNIAGNRKRSENAAGSEKSIAVLPFENMSDGEEYSWFGDAFTDEIIMQLYKIQAFDVRSRTSIMQYKNSDKSSPTIGQELGVEYLLEGSTQRIEDQVRIRVQLIQASTDNHIWGDTFDGNISELIDIQINVSKQIAHLLRTVISPEEINQIEKKPTQNSKAYELYLQGRYLWNQREVTKSFEYFDQAVKLDKEFALAYAGLADYYTVAASWILMDPDSALNRARLLALRSVIIDNTLAEPYATLGYISNCIDLDFELAALLYERSIHLNPNYATAYHWYASFLTSLGKFKEAFHYMDIALSLEPESPIMNYNAGLTYYFAEEYDRAIDQLNKTLQINPKFPGRDYIIACYLQKGQYEEIISEYEKYTEASSIKESFRQDAIQILSNQGAEGFIRFLIELEIESENPDRNTLARYYTFIGEYDRALDIIESNILEKYNDFLFLNVEPALKNLHEEPRFKELMKLIGQ